MDIQIHHTETILSLRQKIASLVGQTRFRLYMKEKELNADQDGMTLKKLKVVNHQSFIVWTLYGTEDTADKEVFVNN